MNKIDPLERLSDVKSEKALLSLIVRHPNILIDVVGRINKHEFYSPQHSGLYFLCESIFNDRGGKDVSFDVANIQAAARKFNISPDFFGADEGMMLVKSLKTSNIAAVESVDGYISTIKHFAVRRKLYQTSEEVQSFLLTNKPNEMDIEEMIGSVEDRIWNINLEYHNVEAEFKKIFEGHTKDLMKRIANPVQFVGLPTGYSTFDNITSGMRRKAVYVITARTKSGKSTWCTNVGINMASRLSIPVLYLDTEMSSGEVVTRAFAKISGATAKELETGKIPLHNQESVLQTSRTAEDLPFYHMRLYGYSFEKVAGLVRKFVAHNVGKTDDGKTKDCLVIFDYIKMPDKFKNSSVFEKETQVLGQITTALKDLADNLDIPILTAAQVNREGDVAASDRIKWFADAVMRWEQKSKKEIDEDIEGGTHRLRITDTRGFPVCYEGINFVFRPKTLRIEETRKQPEGIHAD